MSSRCRRAPPSGARQLLPCAQVHAQLDTQRGTRAMQREALDHARLSRPENAHYARLPTGPISVGDDVLTGELRSPCGIAARISRLTLAKSLARWTGLDDLRGARRLSCALRNAAVVGKRSPESAAPSESTPSARQAAELVAVEPAAASG